MTRLPRRAFKMMGVVLTMPTGLAHESTHALAAILAGCDVHMVLADDDRALWIDPTLAEMESPQRPLIALAPTLAAIGMLPAVVYLYLTAGPSIAAIAAVAVGLFGYPSPADRRVAFGPEPETETETETKINGVDH